MRQEQLTIKFSRSLTRRLIRALGKGIEMTRFIDQSTFKLIKEIISEKDIFRMFSQWEYHRASLHGVRLLTNVEGYESKLLPLHLKKKTFEDKSRVFLQEYYDSSNIFVFSNEILSAHLDSSKIEVPVDYSLLLDSNYVGTIDLFFQGKPLGNNRGAFLSSLQHIRGHNLNTDALPYLFENAAHVEDRWDDIRRTFSNFLRFSTAVPKKDKVEYIDDIDIRIGQSEALNIADERLKNFYFGSLESKALEEQLLRRQRFYYILLSIVHIEHCDNGNLKEKFTKTIKILDEEMAGVALREAIFAYLYFKNNGAVPILANLRKSIRLAGSSSEALRNISWDMFFFRLMETWASDASRGKFFIPFFVTFDKRLAGLNEIYPIKTALFHDSQKKMVTIPVRDASEVIDNVECNEIIKIAFSEDKVKSRLERRMPPTEEFKDEMKRKECELDAVFLCNA